MESLDNLVHPRTREHKTEVQFPGYSISSKQILSFTLSTRIQVFFLQSIPFGAGCYLVDDYHSERGKQKLSEIRVFKKVPRKNMSILILDHR